MFESTEPAAPRVSSTDAEAALERLDALPTLNSIAVRILGLTGDTNADSAEVISLINADAALASRVLACCRCAPGGRAANATTVERAVLLLGFASLRRIVLTTSVLETVGEMQGDDSTNQRPFDMQLFWHHSLATAIAAEALAAKHEGDVAPGEAFMAGLLHDIGQLALSTCAPQSFDDACQTVCLGLMGIDQACRERMGLDTHTAGRRLAHHWQLPEAYADCCWLNGQMPEAVPSTTSRDLVLIVTLANALAHQTCPSPFAAIDCDLITDATTAALHLDAEVLDDVRQSLAADVQDRAAMLGLEESVSLQSICAALQRANAALGTLGERWQQQARQGEADARMMLAINLFQEAAERDDVAGGIMRSAKMVIPAHEAVLARTPSAPSWIFITSDGPSDQATVKRLHSSIEKAADAVQAISAHTSKVFHEIILPAGPCGVQLILLAGVAQGGSMSHQLEPLTSIWANGLRWSQGCDAAARLSEDLAQSNRALLETREALTRSHALACIGEVASGAAHEMNNPLAIISGRAQLLAIALEEAKENDAALLEAARTITSSASELSDMISAMRAFAEPLRLDTRPTSIQWLLDAALECASDVVEHNADFESMVHFDAAAQGDACVRIDGPKLSEAIAELIANATRSPGVSDITVRIEIEASADRWYVVVADNGRGMTEHQLAHALDPFFSSHQAGRRPGLGLARVRRIATAHGGEVVLKSAPNGGVHAALVLSLSRCGWQARRRSA